MLSMNCRRAGFMVFALWASAGFAQSVDAGWAEDMFEKTKYDFGFVARGADASYRFKITNKYTQPVHISNTRTTCGCTAARPSKDLLQSGESAYIEVTMDTRKFTRRKDSNLIVTFDAPQPAEVQIPITAYIRTDVVLTPGMVNFGAIGKGTASQKTIDIAYAGRDDWKITKVESKNPHMAAKVVEKNRGNGRVDYQLVVDLKEDAPVGDLRDQLVLYTDDAKSPRVPVLVEGRVEAEITINPRSVSFGVVSSDENKTVNIVLRGRKPFTIEKIESDSGDPSFEVRLPKTSKPIHVLPLSINKPKKSGKFAERFTVTIKGMKDPIQFVARGEVLPTTAGK